MAGSLIICCTLRVGHGPPSAILRAACVVGCTGPSCSAGNHLRPPGHSGKARRESVRPGSLLQCTHGNRGHGRGRQRGKIREREAGQESLQARAAPPCSWSPGRALSGRHPWLLCSPSSPPGRLPSGTTLDWRQEGEMQRHHPEHTSKARSSPPLNTVTPQPNTSFTKRYNLPRHTGRVCSLQPSGQTGAEEQHRKTLLKVGSSWMHSQS